MRAAARDAGPKEACGMLLGEGMRVASFIAADNVHPTPESHFEIDPQALIDAHRAARAGAAGVVGYFHSHPTGNARPSATDQASSARDGSIWAIAAGDVIAFWRDEPSGFAALSYCEIEA